MPENLGSLAVRSLVSLRLSLQNVGGREIREGRGGPRRAESKKSVVHIVLFTKLCAQSTSFTLQRLNPTPRRLHLASLIFFKLENMPVEGWGLAGSLRKVFGVQA